MPDVNVGWGNDAPAFGELNKFGIRAGADGRIQAAADFLGNGAIEINKYESEILDIVRRESDVISRWKRVPSTGQPHRYFEQVAIASGQFVPLNQASPPMGTPTASSPTRVERTVFIKALSAQTNLSLFDVDVTRQQGQFAYVEAKDIADIAAAIARQEAQAVWNGTDTSLTTPTTNQYMGLLAQINQQATIAPGASIVDGLKAQVAYLAANTDFKVKPTSIVVNPILGDYIDREAKAQNIKLGEATVAGVVVHSIPTQVGMLPLIPDPWLPSASGSAYGFSAPPAGNKNYFAAILTDEMIELPYVHGGDGSPLPRIFQLGLVGGLLGQYVGILFNAVVAKGVNGPSPSPTYGVPANGCYAHTVVAVQRP